MSKYQVAFNSTTKKAMIQSVGSDIPSGSTNIGTFDHDDSADGLGPEVNHVLYQHVRDLLYFQKEYNMQIVSIITQAGIPVTAITVAPSSQSLQVGNTLQLSIQYVPQNTTDTTVTYASSNTAVATVDSKGLVTGVAAGVATITATSTTAGVTSTSSVNVFVAVTGISVQENSISLVAGATSQLAWNVQPQNATDKNVTFTSSNTDVCTVDANGLVTGVAAGSAGITLTTEAGNFSTQVSVNVTAAVAATVAVQSLSLDKTTASVNIGDSVTLTPTILPANATDKTIEWNVSDATIATISDGLVTGVKAGTVTVGANASGQKASATVTVNPAS